MFNFRVHKHRFKDVGSFENDLYTGILKDSCKCLNKAKDIRNKEEDIFLTSRQASGFIMGISGFFSGSWIIHSG